MFNLENIQAEIQKSGLDGWLFYDFKSRNIIAQRILDFSENSHPTRRWFYFIPAKGEPQKLVHAIERGTLDHLPGNKNVYLPWKELPNNIKLILGDSKNIAMEYAKDNSIPYISIIDAGTVELVKSIGVDIHSSGNLVSVIESFVTQEDKQTHIKAGELITQIKEEAFKLIREKLDNNETITEYDVYLFFHKRYNELGLFADHGPIIAINQHAADPHFEPTKENALPIKNGDLLLFDMFAKLDQPNSIWYDITWMTVIGKETSERIKEINKITIDARNVGLNLVKEKFSKNLEISGAEVDDAVRNYIVEKGFGQYFIHRTGHNIATQLHGNGTHIDNLETNDTRLIIKGSCFSIEPGIYIPDEKIGFRSEIDVWVNEDGSVEVFGPIQEEMIYI